jgi:hypothetical protein
VVLPDEAKNGKFSFSVFDLMGRELKRNEEVLSSSENKIDITQLSSGMYLLKVSNGKISGTKRFVKK